MTLSPEEMTLLLTIGSIVSFIIFILVAAGLWKTFTKAGQPGWPAIIPILNGYYVVKISGHPGWWILLFFVPFVNLVIWLMVALDTAYAFGKTTWYGALIYFFPFVMFLLLGFGEATYIGPKTMK